jgi:nucleoid DNA-binding protein
LLKRDFVRLIKEKLSVTQKEAEAIFDTIKEQMILGEKITIPDFGIFEITTRPPKQGYNPHSGERIDIPAYKVIRFKPSKNFKSLLKDNGGSQP